MMEVFDCGVIMRHLIVFVSFDCVVIVYDEMFDCDVILKVEIFDCFFYLIVFFNSLKMGYLIVL